MIDTPLATIFARIGDALEHRIAPELDSPMLRGQVLTVVELLAQLAGKVEYRRDLLLDDIERARQVVALLVGVLDDTGVAVPDDVRAAAASFDPASAPGDELLVAKRRAKARASEALRLFESVRADVADAGDVESRVLALLAQGAMRDIMMFRPQRFDTISQREEQE